MRGRGRWHQSDSIWKLESMTPLINPDRAVLNAFRGAGRVVPGVIVFPVKVRRPPRLEEVSIRTERDRLLKQAPNFTVMTRLP